LMARTKGSKQAPPQRTSNGSAAEVARLEGELRKVGETVAALTASIDPANLALLNDKLTQLRLRKEHLEQELAAAKLAGPSRDERVIRQWAKRQLVGLADALNGRRDDEARRVVGSYVERITLWPSAKRGEMALHPDCWSLWRSLDPGKHHDRPERRSGGNEVAGARHAVRPRHRKHGVLREETASATGGRLILPFRWDAHGITDEGEVLAVAAAGRREGAR